MSYQEKRTGANIFSGVLILVAYCLYAFNPARLATIAPGDLKPWAVTMLIFIVIGIVATIVIQIVFHVFLSISTTVQEKIKDMAADEKEILRIFDHEMIEDERDRQIDLKALRFSSAVIGTGFIAALLALALNASPVVMLNILFLSFLLGTLLEGAGQFYYYRKGG